MLTVEEEEAHDVGRETEAADNHDNLGVRNL